MLGRSWRYARLVSTARIHRKNLIGWTAEHGPHGAKHAIAVSLAHLEVWRSVAGRVVGAIAIIAVAVSFWIWIFPEVASIKRFVAYAMFMGTFTAVMLYPIIAISERKKSRAVIPDQFLISVSIFIGAIYVFSYIRLLGVGGFWPDILKLSLLVAVGIGVFFLLLTAVQGAITSLGNRRSSALYPRATVAYYLVGAEWIAGGGKWLHLVEARTILLEELEFAARALEHDMPRKTASGDPVTDAWLVEQLAQAAAAIRELKHHVVLPAADSVETLATKLHEIAVAFTKNRWSELPKAEVKRLSVRTAGVRLLEIVRSIVIAAIPLGAVTLLSALKVQVPELVMVAAYVWAAVSIITVIDPDFASRLKTVKEVLGLTGGK